MKKVIRVSFPTEDVVAALLSLLSDADRDAVAGLGDPVLWYPLSHLVISELQTFDRPYRPGDRYGDGLEPLGLEWKSAAHDALTAETEGT